MLLTVTPELAARLGAYVRRRVAGPAAEDVVQDVLVRVHQRAGTLRDPAALEGWALRVAHNVVVDHLRVSSPELAVGDASVFEALEVQHDEDEASARLARCLPLLLDQLGTADRQALELCDLGSLTQAQAARRLNLTVPGMKARVQRARRRLRAVIDACCEVELDVRNHVVAYMPPGDCDCACAPAARAAA